MRTVALLLALSGICASSNVNASDEPAYRIIDGAIVALGYTLAPADPLPDAASCDDCGPNHSVSIGASPDGRWILITSDVRLANFDAWVVDTRSLDAPVRIADRRRGRHFAGAEWLSDHTLELSFGGMGYSTSLLFDAAGWSDPEEISHLLLFEPDRNVYVRYLHDPETAKDQIEVGHAFSEDAKVERFTIALDNERLSESRFMIDSVEIDSSILIVTYDTTARGRVRDFFHPQALAK